MANRYLLDTTVFNRVFDGSLDPACFGTAELYATRIQREQLQQTPDAYDRQALLNLFHLIEAIQLKPPTSLWGHGQWGDNWSPTDGLYESILRKIRELTATRRGFSQTHDAQLAETAIRQRLTFVTDDLALARAAHEHGAEVIASDMIDQVDREM